MKCKSQAAALSIVVFASFAAAQTKVCDAKAYGAKGDGATKDTVSLQKAIDDCSAAGGGTVRLAGSPMFVSGPLLLKNNITLQIAAGTTLAGSEDHDDYPEMQEFHSAGRQPLLAADHAENITINGGGIIDGRGQSWWANLAPGYTRPRLVVFRYSKHIVMENVTVQNSPEWQIVPYYSDDLTFRNMKVLAPDHESHNTDGIDPFSSGHILIDHVTIDTGDDNVAIKSGQPNSPGPMPPAMTSSSPTASSCMAMVCRSAVRSPAECRMCASNGFTSKGPAAAFVSNPIAIAAMTSATSSTAIL